MDYFKKNLIFELIIVFLVISFFSAGIVFFRFQISKAADQLEVLRKQVYERNDSLKLYSLLQSQYNSKTKSYLGLLSNIIPQEDDLITLRNELIQIASEKYNLDYEFNFKEQTPPTENALGIVEFEMTVRGEKLEQFLKFGQEMQGFTGIMKLTSINISHQDTKMQMKIGGQIYFRKNETIKI